MTNGDYHRLSGPKKRQCPRSSFPDISRPLIPLRTCAILACCFILLSSLPAPVSADDFVGGVPLTTVQTGTVTGDLYIDATPPLWAGLQTSNIVKTFTLPEAAVAEPGRVKWARLYISAYCGHMQNNYNFSIINRWDGDGLSGYETIWDEPYHAGFQYLNQTILIDDTPTMMPLGNDNTALGGGLHDGFRMLSDHENRVTSDYFMWYDVTDLVKNQTIFVNVDTTGAWDGETFDGRTKMATLLVAYDDPSSATQTEYWVNQGHDVCTYYTETNLGKVAVGSTTFATKGIEPFSSATLTINYLASHNGLFGFPTKTNTQNPGNYWTEQVWNDTYGCEVPVFMGTLPSISFTSPLSYGYDVQGPYSGIMHWDVTDKIPLATNARLGFSRDVTQTGLSAFYKLPLAFLVIKRPLSGSLPDAGFSANATSGPAPLTVQFNDTSTGEPTAWTWDFGDIGAGNTSSEQNPAHTYTVAGSYAVNLTATNAQGSDSEEKTGFISVTGTPLIASFTNSTPRSGIGPLTVAFNDTSTGEITSRVWDFENEGTADSTERNASYTYSSAGSYSVKISVTGTAGTNSTVKDNYITVLSLSGAPVAEFYATPVTGSAPMTVLFTDTTTNDPTSRIWDFGDGNSTWSTTATTFAHTYTTAGSYTVKLTAGNAQGNDEEAKTNYVLVTSGSGSSTLSLSPRVQSFNTGESREYQIVLDSLPRGIAGFDMYVTLTNASVAEITGVTYPSWAQLSKTPLVPNSTVRLNAVDTDQQVWPGAVSVVLANITVRGISDGMTPIGLIGGEFSADGGGLPITISAVNNGTAVVGSYAGPVAAFSANTTTGSVPLTILFTDESAGTPISWAWDFNNDGTIDSRDQNPLVTYATVGTYTISLNATNNDGSDVLVKPDYVSAYVGSLPPPPVAGFSNVTPLSGTAPLTVLFTDTTTNDPTGRVWDFGDGNSTWSTTATTFAHTYTSAGTFSVKLTATNAYGSDDETKTGYVTVRAASSGPVAAFTASTTSGNAPLTVTFTDTSSGEHWYWSWTFGDSTTSTLKNPTHTYNDAGSYTASLIVSADEETWSNPATRSITVHTGTGAPGAAFSVSATSGAAPLTVTFTDTSSDDPTSWAWDFDGDGDTDSTAQNPSYTYTTVGTYTAELTVANDKGSDSETKTITVTSSATPADLTVEAIVPNIGGTASGNVFALEQNPVTIRIKNGGTGASTATTVKLVSGDGFSGTATVPAIDAGAETLVVITDTTSRSTAGGSVTYTATADPESKVSESNENNNVKTSTSSCSYNGYKGKRYWSGMTGGGDITTKYTYDLHGGLLYSRGNSEYTSGSFGENGWLTHTVNWQDADLPVPSGATVKKAFLYVPYTWDNEHIVDTHTTIDFNGERISRSAWYWDQSNFGSYANYAYGLSTYDVTAQFKKNEANSAVFTRSNPNYDDPAEAAIYTKLSMYEFFLVIIYEDSTASRQQIFLNEGFDLLGASVAYGTTPAESIAYIPFTGMTIDKDAMEKATLITFVPSGDSNEGNLLYNGNSIANGVWSWGGTGTGANGGHQVAEDIRDVSSRIQSTGNTFGIQSTIVGPDAATPCMAAAQQFLIIDYGGGTSQSTYSSGSTTTTTSTSTKETISSLSTTSGTTTAARSTGAARSSESSTNTVPDTSSVRSMLAPSEQSASDLLDNPPVSGSGGTANNGGDLMPGALLSGIAVIGATGVFAYRSGWIPNGNGGNRLFGHQQVLCHDGSGTCPPLSLDIMSGTISAPSNSGTGYRFQFPPLHPSGGSWRLVAGLIFAAGVIGAAVLFGLPALSGIGTTGTETAGTPFSLLPTVEKIADLDTSNHIPDYPSGFSARNGILFVYSGAEKIPVSNLGLRLSKGASEVFITTASHPPVKNAVNPELTTYFEEMGNGDGTLDPGEWLMVYADNCYDSSTSDSNPRGQVLIWQPEDSKQRVEVPVKDTIGYTLTDISSGTTLQQGTLSFIPP